MNLQRAIGIIRRRPDRTGDQKIRIFKTWRSKYPKDCLDSNHLG